MGNRSLRHLDAGNHNLKGKKSKEVCPCCDPIYNYKEKILLDILDKEVQNTFNEFNEGENNNEKR